MENLNRFLFLNTYFWNENFVNVNKFITLASEEEEEIEQENFVLGKETWLAGPLGLSPQIFIRSTKIKGSRRKWSGHEDILKHEKEWQVATVPDVTHIC